MSVMTVPDEQQAIAELVAAKRDLVGGMSKQIDFYVEHYGLSPSEAAARARQISTEAAEHQPSSSVSWMGLGPLLESDVDRGLRIWNRLKAEAEAEFKIGFRALRSVEPDGGGSPLARAELSVMLRAFTEAWQPQNMIETALVQQLAIAYDRHLFWQKIASQRLLEEEWEGERDKRRALENMSPREKERYQENHGWLPARVTKAEAIDQAVMIADRYQRQFLRLLKAMRDQRRLFDSLVVTGGQVNVGQQQQVVMSAEQRPARKSRPPRKNAQPKGATA